MRATWVPVVAGCVLVTLAWPRAVSAGGQAVEPCPRGTHRVATGYGSYCAAGATGKSSGRSRRTTGAYAAYCAPTSGYELVDAKTGAALAGACEISALGNDESKATTYVQLILGGLGCPAASQPSAPPATAPCRFGKLYLDPVGNGSPSGRALIGVLTKILAKDGRVQLAGSPGGAQAIFADVGEYKIEQQAAKQAQEAKREQAEQARQAAEATKEAERREAEEAAEAARFAAAHKVGPLRHYIAYVVESDCDDKQVDVTYDVGSDQTEQNTEDAPWAELVTYARGSLYSLLAQKHDGSDYCSVSAEIYTIMLSRRQVHIWSNSLASPVAPIKRYGKQLREADSDSAYGIASVSYSTGF